tara:strand:+ start:396 stop:1475 length:1080 start_codon:yes stop_codon:yes gene_type:complete
MNKNYFFLLISCITFLISCKESNTKKTNIDINLDSISHPEQIIDKGNPIDFENTKVLSQVYVTSKNNIEAKQDKDNNSKTVHNYMYAEKLDVIEDNGIWLGIRERIRREFIQDGKTIQLIQWEKVYVPKIKTGSIEQIKISSSDLYSNNYLIIKEKEVKSDYEKQIKEYLIIELIDKDFYNSKKEQKIDFLIADTNEIKKKNGTIELKCQNKTVTYSDKPDAEEQRQEFEYIGQINFLNKYLISCSYWENSDFRFVDKITAEETNLLDYPYISQDKKNIICIFTNPYDTSADIEIYSINESNIQKVLFVSFDKWMPVESHDFFWNKDGYLYLAAINSNVFWSSDGNTNKKAQYIRIKII